LGLYGEANIVGAFLAASHVRMEFVDCIACVFAWGKIEMVMFFVSAREKSEPFAIDFAS
jgi:hypothetical protein